MLFYCSFIILDCVRILFTFFGITWLSTKHCSSKASYWSKLHCQGIFYSF